MRAMCALPPNQAGGCFGERPTRLVSYRARRLDDRRAYAGQAIAGWRLAPSRGLAAHFRDRNDR
jgi:hypothetical protein